MRVTTGHGETLELDSRTQDEKIHKLNKQLAWYRNQYNKLLGENQKLKSYVQEPDEILSQ